MQVSKTNYKKESGASTPRSGESASFLEAKIPSPPTATLVDSLLGAVGQIVEDAGDAAERLIQTKPAKPSGKNSIKLISEQQEAVRKSVMEKIKVGINESLVKIRQGGAGLEERENALANNEPVPVVEGESTLVPISISENIKEIRKIIIGMEKAIRKFDMTDPDELPLNPEEQGEPQTESDRILMDLNKAEHIFHRWDFPRRGSGNKFDSESESQNLISKIEKQLLRIPKRLAADVLSDQASTTTEEHAVVQSRLKDLAELIESRSGESLSQSQVSSARYHDADSEIFEIMQNEPSHLDLLAKELITPPGLIESEADPPQWLAWAKDPGPISSLKISAGLLASERSSAKSSPVVLPVMGERSDENREEKQSSFPRISRSSETPAGDSSDRESALVIPGEPQTASAIKSKSPVTAKTSPLALVIQGADSLETNSPAEEESLNMPVPQESKVPSRTSPKESLRMAYIRKSPKPSSITPERAASASRRSPSPVQEVLAAMSKQQRRSRSPPKEASPAVGESTTVTSGSPTRRAQRRLGNYTLRSTSPPRTVPPKLKPGASESPHPELN